ncbi:hypothetical protein M8J76_012396 [Diaphorina citri]|nr:hypothetical protein M8J75_001628 [Diaphorina citri]KAI5716782.1 hypothetical protein M8J76_012396 [Diaphorina citri]
MNEEQYEEGDEGEYYKQIVELDLEETNSNESDVNMSEDLDTLNIFRKSTLTPRSPIEHGKLNEENENFGTFSTPRGVLDENAAWVSPMITNPSKKRKMVASPILDPAMSEFMQAVEKMCQHSDLLNRYVKQNTKTEIKDAVKELAALAVGVRSMKKGIKDLKHSEICSPKSQEEETRKEFCNKCKQEIVDEEKLAEEIKDEIIKLNGKPELDASKTIELLKKKWPGKVFETTTLVQGNITKQPPEHSKVIIITKNEIDNLSRTTNNWIDKITEQPGIVEKISTRMYKPILCEKQSKLCFLEDEEDAGVEQNNVFLIAIENEITEENMLSQVKAFKAVQMKIPSKKTLDVAPTGNISDEKIRKVLEFSFKNTKTKINIVRKEKNEKEETGKLIIKSEGTSFADLFKNVKQNINPEQLNIDFKKIRRTKDGSVMLETKGKDAETLKQEIMSKMDNITVTAIGGKKTIEILDLDPTITKEEIIEEISKISTTEEQAECTVDNLRSTRSGWQIANITVTKSLAEKLLNIGVIKIGWISCRIKQKINIDRCINCLQVGHMARQCKMPRSLDIKCLKCAGDGHIAKNCDNERFCVKCNVNGHRNDSYACPHYRALVNSLRY